MQRAFYYEGKSLSDPATYREIAIANNLDTEADLSRFEDVSSIKDAHADFMKVHQLGGGVMTAEKIGAGLESVIS